MAVPDTKPESYMIGVLLLCCVGSCYGNSCSSLAEGGPCTFTCEEIPASSNMTIMWETVARMKAASPLFTCSPQTEECRSSSTKVANQYQANISSIGDTEFISHLTIKDTQFFHKDMTFNCMLYDSLTSETTFGKIFKMSDVYGMPQNVSCQAHFLFPDKINLSCHTAKIYPEPICEFHSNTRDGKELGTEDSSFKYIKTLSQDIGFYSAQCSAIVNIRQPGKYKYQVAMFPKLKNVKSADRSEIVTETNQVVLAESSLSLRVLCDTSQQRMYLNCTALFFHHPFQLQWVIGQERKKKMLAERLTGKYYSLQSTYEYLPSRSPMEEIVKCKISFVVGVFEKTSEKAMKMLRSPSPPKFQYRGVAVEASQDIHVREGDDVGLTCLVEGGKTPVSSLHLQCRSSDQSVILLDKRWNGSKATFTLGTDEHLHKITCECSANHVTQCYNLRTTVTISVAAPIEPARSDSTPFYLRTNCIILYVLLTVAAAVGTAGIVVLYMFCRSTCKMYRHQLRPTSSRATSSPPVPDRKNRPVPHCRYQPAHSGNQAIHTTRV